MSELNFEPMSNGSLSVSAALDDDQLAISLVGTADQRETDFLDAVLERVHQEAERHEVARVIVDVRDLEFMNSTAFKSLLSWITTILALPQASQYMVRFLSTSRHHWQRRSLDALRCFAVNLISIEA